MKKKPFDQDLYQNIKINDLILFCIFLIAEKREKCTFERLIEECFALFPRAFSFSSISKWPDSRKLDRPLRDLRKKKLIEGNPNLFCLTKLGRKMIERISKNFGQRKLKI